MSTSIACSVNCNHVEG